MMLWEEGAFELSDPVSRWLPEFAQPRVYVGVRRPGPSPCPRPSPIRMWHLLTHIAGLTYGFHQVHVTDEIYRLRGFELGAPHRTSTSPRACARGPSSRSPSSPVRSGTTRWPRTCSAGSSRSSPDRPRPVLRRAHPRPARHDGHRVRRRRGRAGTPGRALRPDAARRQAVADAGDRVLEATHAALGRRRAGVDRADYTRFTRMLLQRRRARRRALLAPHRRLHDPQPPARWRRPRRLRPAAVRRDAFDGVGFGLGFSVVVDPVANRTPTTVGEYHWGGWRAPPSGSTRPRRSPPSS